MDFQKEVTESLTSMGFELSIVSKAYSLADIKTVEGVINYIDAHPELYTSAMDEEKSTAQSQPNPFEDGAMEEETKPVTAQPEGIPITSHINTQLRDNLIAMGYARNPSEKALLLTGNKSIQDAIEWMDQNKNEPDFNEQMFLVAPDPGAQQESGIKRSNLTPEEAKAQAKELQRQIREKRAAKEAELEKQREADRIRGGKDMTEALRKMKETQMRLDVDYLKRERAEQEAAKQKILEKIEQDRYNRTGKKLEKKLLPVKQIVSDIYHKMRKVYPKGSMAGEQVNICLKTCGIYIGK